MQPIAEQPARVQCKQGTQSRNNLLRCKSVMYEPIRYDTENGRMGCILSSEPNAITLEAAETIDQ